MSKAEMEAGLAAGRSLVQEEWSEPLEIVAADELVLEGKATATDWEYLDGFQCECRIVRGVTVQ